MLRKKRKLSKLLYRRVTSTYQMRAVKVYRRSQPCSIDSLGFAFAVSPSFRKSSDSFLLAYQCRNFCSSHGGTRETCLDLSRIQIGSVTFYLYSLFSCMKITRFMLVTIICASLAAIGASVVCITTRDGTSRTRGYTVQRVLVSTRK
jgi:hypothetical protein